MTGFIHATARLIRASQRAYERKWSFLALFMSVFFVSTLVLAHFDLLPDAPKASIADAATLPTTPVITTPTAVSTPEAPIKISIPVISLTATVANPQTIDVETLDKLLLSGAVRYPTSAKLGENGNVVIFGHSSYLPVVHNQAYKTFDGIQKLKAGDTITVYSSQTVYVYAVKAVAKESANTAAIPLNIQGRELTLSTCDSFGSKSDRFVVTADFVESHSLGA